MTTRRPRGKVGQFTKTLDAETLDKIAPPPDSLDDEGTILWYRIWAAGGGWLTDADYAVVSEICELFEEKQYYKAASKTVPSVYRMTNGAIAKHPYIEMLWQSRKDFNALLATIGFNPKDRANISAIESLVEDPIKELVKRKNEREAARRAANNG